MTTPIDPMAAVQVLRDALEAAKRTMEEARRFPDFTVSQDDISLADVALAATAHVAQTSEPVAVACALRGGKCNCPTACRINMESASLLSFPVLHIAAKAVADSAEVWTGFAALDAKTCIQAALHATPQALPATAQARDWTEDFQHENGNYMNTCSTCRSTFMGYKRRTTCKVCAVSQAKPDLPMPDYKIYAVIDKMGWDLDDAEKDDMHALCVALLAAQHQAAG